ncbi:MAG TPA: 1,2-phenylacetyl-CoA epoxidase subunit PaaD [Chryseosolibacter sp.]
MSEITADMIREWLKEVKDPEIPVLSLIDLGVIRDIALEGGEVTIEMTPTFVGCPALETMKEEIHKTLREKGLEKIHIDVNFRKPWTSDLISDSGRRALKSFGLAPPPPNHLFMDLDVLEYAVCPRCGNTNTELRNTFGPTLCRSIHYCNDCKEAFEQFKPL